MADDRDPLLEPFAEMRKYVEFSHKELSQKLDLTRVDLARLERKVDSGFDRLGRKIDTLGASRRAARRRRKP